jgi:hypothetical protein
VYYNENCFGACIISKPIDGVAKIAKILLVMLWVAAATL